MMSSLMLSVLICSGLGAALAGFGRRAFGTVAFIGRWRRGAIYGALLGLMFHMVSCGNSAGSLNQSTRNVTRISESQFDTEVLQAALPVVVDFYATWCGPCKKLSPMLDAFAGTLTNQVKFVKVDIDAAPALARRYSIEAVPTLLLFKEGKISDRIVGVPPAEQLKLRLETLARASRVDAK